MQTYALVLIGIFLVIILVILIKIYNIIRPGDLKEGDIVIVTNPHCGEKEMNMITEVIHILSPSTVQLRGAKTTISMHRKWVRRIDVDKRFSVKVPEKPVGNLGANNLAEFREIPLSWFSYKV